MPRTPYDINASWDDPFERQTERRAVSRIPIRFQVKIAVHLAHKSAPLVGPGTVYDISTVAIRCHTKHRVARGQAVQLYISTKICPPELGLPKSFMGGAQVVRSEPLEGGVFDVALRFDDGLRDDIQFALFVEWLQAVAPVTNA